MTMEDIAESNKQTILQTIRYLDDATSLPITSTNIRNRLLFTGDKMSRLTINRAMEKLVAENIIYKTGKDGHSIKYELRSNHA